MHMYASRSTVLSRANLELPNRPVRAIHSALCARVLLNLRKAAAKSSSLPLSEFTQMSCIAFEETFLRQYDSERYEVTLGIELDEMRYPVGVGGA